MKKWMIAMAFLLIPVTGFAVECETNDDCGENEACMPDLCEPCAEGEECPPCGSSCVELGEGESQGPGIPTCETDDECPIGLSCQEAEISCGVPISGGGCACPDCPEGEECPPCDCDEEEVQPEPEIDPDCPDGFLIVMMCQPVECVEGDVCGDNFSCQPSEMMCKSGGSGGSTTEPGEVEVEGEENTTDPDEEGGDGSEEEPVDGEEEAPGEGGEGEGWEEDCEVLAFACFPDEIECATDEACPTDWECIEMNDTLTVEDGACACPPCEMGEECPPCECDDEETEEVVEPDVETLGVCVPPGWADWMSSMGMDGNGGSTNTGISDPETEEGEELSSEEGGEVAEEGGEAAAEEGGEAASEEGGEAASEEGGEAASEEGGEAASEEGGEAASEEGGEAASEEGGEAAPGEGGDEAASGEGGDEAASEEGGDEAASEEGGDEAAVDAAGDDDGGCSSTGNSAPLGIVLVMMGLLALCVRTRETQF